MLDSSKNHRLILLFNKVRLPLVACLFKLQYSHILHKEERVNILREVSAETMGAAVSRKWSTGLCDCGGSLSTCCITYFLPCVTFGRIAEIMDEGHTSCVTHGCLYALLTTVQCHWFYSCIYREKLRSKYGLPSEPCCDCAVHFFCEPCALCQEYAELNNRGFDASKGFL